MEGLPKSYVGSESRCLDRWHDLYGKRFGIPTTGISGVASRRSRSHNVWRFWHGATLRRNKDVPQRLAQTPLTCPVPLIRPATVQGFPRGTDLSAWPLSVAVLHGKTGILIAHRRLGTPQSPVLRNSEADLFAYGCLNFLQGRAPVLSANHSIVEIASFEINQKIAN